MADDVLNVEKRELLGSANARRLRRAGKIPAILYGHGKDPVSLSVRSDEMRVVMSHGGQLVELKGGVSDTAFLKEIQLDALGSRILHIDLTRVSAGETVDVTVKVETRGVAPGTKQGGTVDNPVHEVQITCPAMSIPEKIELSINELELDQSLTAGDLVLPKGATLITDAGTVIVSCAEAAEVADDVDTAAPSDGAEPEVIGRKEEDEGGGGE